MKTRQEILSIPLVSQITEDIVKMLGEPLYTAIREKVIDAYVAGAKELHPADQHIEDLLRHAKKWQEGSGPFVEAKDRAEAKAKKLERQVAAAKALLVITRNHTCSEKTCFMCDARWTLIRIEELEKDEGIT